VLDGVVASTVAVMGAVAAEATVTDALVLGAHALGGEELLWPAATLLALLFLA
jgi:hypothetical protein